MYNGLEYIEEKFPHFFDFSENSNNKKISNIIHHNFKELHNSLKAVRNGYYFIKDVPDIDLKVKNFPVIAFEDNEIIFKTTRYECGDEIRFSSSNFGELGTVKLKQDLEDLEFTEHISIKTLEDSYEIIIIAPDIKKIRVYDLNNETVKSINFDYRKHQNSHDLNVTPNTHNYKVIVETWDEYTYTTYSNQINPDLDIIGTLVGCSRRDYNEDLI